GHAFSVALVCEHLSRSIDPNEQHHKHQTAYMAGLLHDIGRAVLGMRVDLAYFERATGHLHGQELIAAEAAYYGVDHAEAGMRLLRLWNFPDKLCLAIGEHHAATPHLLLGKICQSADQYVRKYIPARTPFDSIPVLLKQTLADQPPPTESLQTA
ncbi:MAG: HDOD domain-containing protein, partial [Mariprofundaceae bacterium]